MPESRSRAPLVWIDCEMTGLDPDIDTILSIACFVTDYNLSLSDSKGLELIVHHDKEDLDSMGDWCKITHGTSGLTERCLESKTTPEEAAQQLLEYIQKYIHDSGTALLAGNTVHMDKSFLRKEPYGKVVDYLNHRILDVSAIKEAARRWATLGLLADTPEKKGLHDAKADVLESIEEARYYKKAIFGK